MTRFLAGLAQAPIDLIAAVDDAFIAQHGLAKGQCVQLTLAQAQSLQAALPDIARQPGGSVGNVLAAYATLGGACAFMGAVADDALGDVFRADCASRGVAWRGKIWPQDELGTTRIFCLTTPDAERSFATYQGVNARLDETLLEPDTIRHADLIVLDGFTLPGPHVAKAYLAAITRMHEKGGQAAFLLGDVSILRDFPETTEKVLDSVDGLFVNEHEAAFIFGTSDLGQLAKTLSGRYAFGAMTLGAQGAFVFHNGQAELVPIPDTHIAVVDTNGAGDNFVGGFLYGLRHGRSLKDSARIGHLCAASVIGHFGARLKPDFTLPNTAL